MHLIGRDRELALLWSDVAGALDARSGRTLVIEGSAGVGKTSLLGALAERVKAERTDATVGWGACRSGNAEPFLPFVEALETLGHGRAQGSLKQLLLEVAPEWLGLVPLMGGLLSASVATVTRVRKGSHASDERLFSEYLKLLERLAQETAIVLLLDDLHLADRGSAALLAHLGRRIRDLPLALVLTIQPPPPGEEALVLDIVPELERERLARRWEIRELTRADAAQLAAAEMGGPISTEVEEWLLHGAGGNPLFLQQLIALLRDSGTLERTADGTWSLEKGHAPPAVPASAEEATAHRLRRLESEQLRLLQYAAVQGRTFDSAVLTRVLERDELAVLDDLERLVRDHRLVRPVGETSYAGESGTRFQFTETSTHTALDRQVVGKRRVLLCRRMAEVLESLGAADGGHSRLDLARLQRESRRAGRTEIHDTPRPDAGRAVEPGAATQERRGPSSGVEASPESELRSSRFVGRTKELAALKAAIEQAFAGEHGRVLLIEGPAGTGKSTLAAELLGRVAEAESGIGIGRGRCLQAFEATDPYLPFVTALHDLADEATTGAVERERLSEMLVELAPYWLAAVPVVGNLLSASFLTATAVRERRAPPSREALFEQYADLLRSIAERGPLILLLEDLHWADRSTLELLSSLARRIGDLPLVLLGTLRPPPDTAGAGPLAELIEELEEQGLASRLQLAELPEEAVKDLLQDELGGEPSDPLLRWVVGVTGGNPLFASELARLLLESGAVADRRGEWELTDRVHEVGVPRTAEAVLERRVQRLTPAEVRVLQYASVAGAEFNSLLISRLLESEHQQVRDLLLGLEQHQLVVESGATARVHAGDVAIGYRFRHALVHAVVYGQVRGKRRTLLHRRAGEVLESLHPEDVGSVAAPLARHFHVAGVGDRAFRYGQMAADSARGLFANWEAEELYRIARQHSPTPESAVDMDERLGDLYDRLGYYDEAAEHFGRVVISPAVGRARSLRARRKLIAIERKTGQTPAPALLERVEALLPDAGDVPRERCYLLLELARLPDAKNAVEAATEAVALAASMDDPILEADALDRLAIALIFRERPKSALPHLDRARQLSRERENPVRTSLNRNLAGIAYCKLGAYDRALECFQEMLELSERSGELNSIGVACVNIGQTLLRLGRLDEAEQILQRARKIHERRDQATIIQSLFNLAERARRSGERELAAERYRELRVRAGELGYWTMEAVACAGLGLTALAAGRPEDARTAAEEAAELVRSHDEWFEDREYIELLLARLDHLEGRVDAAIERLERTAERLTDIDRYQRGAIQLQQARMLAERDVPRALALLNHVEDLARGSGSDLQGGVDRLRRRLKREPSLRDAEVLTGP